MHREVGRCLDIVTAAVLRAAHSSPEVVGQVKLLLTVNPDLRPQDSKEEPLAGVLEQAVESRAGYHNGFHWTSEPGAVGSCSPVGRLFRGADRRLDVLSRESCLAIKATLGQPGVSQNEGSEMADLTTGLQAVCDNSVARRPNWEGPGWCRR